MRFTDFIALGPIARNLNPMSFLNHFTLGDFAGVAWNTLMATAPLGAGLVVAAAVTTLVHNFIPQEKSAVQKFLSCGAIAGSFIVGSNISYMIAARINVISFSADKAIRLATLGISIPGASVGFYGNRMLCALGSLGAIVGALKVHRRQGT